MIDVDDSSLHKHGLDPRDFLATDPWGKKVKVQPKIPAVILSDPKYAHNLGQTVRALSCFGVGQLWWTGQRVIKALEGMDRIPREERMKGYQDVQIVHTERPLDPYEGMRGVTPVAVELRDNAEDLIYFEHPENAVYVFGPEDGSIHQGTLHACHRFVRIPTRHCTNLSAAVYLVLYDRAAKMARKAL